MKKLIIPIAALTVLLSSCGGATEENRAIENNSAEKVTKLDSLRDLSNEIEETEKEINEKRESLTNALDAL